MSGKERTGIDQKRKWEPDIVNGVNYVSASLSGMHLFTYLFTPLRVHACVHACVCPQIKAQRQTSSTGKNTGCYNSAHFLMYLCVQT